MTKLRHYDNLGTSRFVTIACHRDLALLSNPHIVMIFLEELDSGRARYGFKLLAYVVMPEHSHFVIQPPDEFKLGPAIGVIKSLSGQRISRYLQEADSPLLRRLHVVRDRKAKYAIWRRRCHDHNCRSLETTLEKIRYCHNNPVRRGLVQSPADWPWSSYGWYHGDFSGPIAVDLIEL